MRKSRPPFKPLAEPAPARPASEIDRSPLDVPVESTGRAIMEIRRRSGLAWEELADLLDISRRSLHHWVNGKPVTAKRERMIRRMLAALRHLDQGGRSDTRAFLLSEDPETGIPTLDLLKDGRFDEATRRGAGIRMPDPHRSPLSPAAQDARRPQPPILLLGAEQDRLHFPAKEVRLSRARRISKTTG